MSWNKVNQTAQDRLRWKVAVEALSSDRSEEKTEKVNEKEENSFYEDNSGNIPFKKDLISLNQEMYFA